MTDILVLLVLEQCSFLLKSLMMSVVIFLARGEYSTWSMVVFQALNFGLVWWLKACVTQTPTNSILLSVFKVSPETLGAWWSKDGQVNTQLLSKVSVTPFDQTQEVGNLKSLSEDLRERNKSIYVIWKWGFLSN